MLEGSKWLSYVSVTMLLNFNISTTIPVESNMEIGMLNIDNLKASYAQEIAELKKEINSFQLRVTNLEKGIDRIENGFLPTVDKSKTAENHTVHKLNKRAVVRRRRLRRAPEVAFQASLSKEYATFELYDAIRFNDVITNIGGAYNKHTGVFTAPVSGTYSFYTNIVSERGHYVEAAIQVNNKATVSAISDHRLSPNSDYLDIWDQGNAVAILSLRKGDKVSVTIQWPQGRHDIHGVGKSSFSGSLLRAHHW